MPARTPPCTKPFPGQHRLPRHCSASHRIGVLNNPGATPPSPIPPPQCWDFHQLQFPPKIAPAELHANTQTSFTTLHRLARPKDFFPKSQPTVRFKDQQRAPKQELCVFSPPPPQFQFGDREYLKRLLLLLDFYIAALSLHAYVIAEICI